MDLLNIPKKRASLNQISSFCHYLEINSEFDCKGVRNLLRDYEPSEPEIKRLNYLFLASNWTELRKMLDDIAFRLDRRSLTHEELRQTNQ